MFLWHCIFFYLIPVCRVHCTFLFIATRNTEKRSFREILHNPKKETFSKLDNRVFIPLSISVVFLSFCFQLAIKVFFGCRYQKGQRRNEDLITGGKFYRFSEVFFAGCIFWGLIVNDVTVIIFVLAFHFAVFLYFLVFHIGSITSKLFKLISKSFCLFSKWCHLWNEPFFPSIFEKPLTLISNC